MRVGRGRGACRRGRACVICSLLGWVGDGRGASAVGNFSSLLFLMLDVVWIGGWIEGVGGSVGLCWLVEGMG